MGTQKIIPHLWFDHEAKEAVQFYTTIFPDSEIISSSVLHDTPSGDPESITFTLSGFTMMALSAGPYFQINPSISFFVNFDPSRDDKAKEHLDTLWNALSEGAEILMPLQEYPFSKHYGWIKDRYGVTWQLILSDPNGEERPFIIPSLLFTGNVCGKAEDAIEFYLSVFDHSKKGSIVHYPAGMEMDKEGTVMFSDFMLERQWFSAMDSGYPHDFGFNEAVSLLVECKDQEEIDYYWERLSADSEAEQCGWLKDKYGVSWQISPEIMDTMMKEGTQEQIDRLTQAFLTMKKLDVEQLKAVYGEQI